MKKWVDEIVCSLLLLLVATSSVAQPSLPAGAAEFVRGQRAMRKRDTDAAIRAFENALAANPNLSLSHYYLGYAYQGKTNWERVGENFLEFLRSVDRDDPTAAQLVFHATRQGGLALARTDNSRQAIALLEDTVAANPDDQEAYFFLGLAFYNNELSSLAESRFAKALELDPSDSEAYYYLGRIAYDRGDGVTAAPYLERLVSLDPHSPHVAEAHFLLGSLALKDAAVADEASQAKARAKVHFEKYLKLEPSGPRAEETKKALEALKKKSEN